MEYYFNFDGTLPALAEGLIEMTIPDKLNKRLKKYRLTGKGQHVTATGWVSTVSEYQCYEFLAVDRPLSMRAMDYLRAQITPVSFVNEEYSRGGLKADPIGFWRYDRFQYFF